MVAALCRVTASMHVRTPAQQRQQMNTQQHQSFLRLFNVSHEPQRVLMSGVVHLHRKVAGSLNLGFLPTYLVFSFFFGGCLLIPSGGSIAILQ